jgi:hypothetical protein
MDDERDMQWLRDELDDVAEQLDRRDRVGEKAPSEDAAFGGRVVEHKDGSHMPRDVAERQARMYRQIFETMPPAPARLGLWQPLGHAPGHAPAYTLRENLEAALRLVRSRAPYGQMIVEPRRLSVLDRLRAAVGL